MSQPVPAPPAVSFQALSALADAGTVFACALCGCRFNHGGLVCGSCPMSSGCDLVKCPNCGYQFPRASRIADALAQLWNRWRRKP